MILSAFGDAWSQIDAFFKLCFSLVGFACSHTGVCHLLQDMQVGKSFLLFASVKNCQDFLETPLGPCILVGFLAGSG